MTGTKPRSSYDETVTRVQQFKSSRLNFPDPRTRRDMILEGLSRLKTKVMERNPNFIQHDVESLLTLFVVLFQYERR